MIYSFHPGIYFPEKGKQGLSYLYTRVCSNIIHNSQKATQP